jgi:hypothetical protein
MMDSSKLPADMSGTQLKRLYGGLSIDLERAAYTSGGSQGVANHLAATDFAKQVADNREQLVKLLGGPEAGSSNEAVFGAVQRAASTKSAADIALLQKAQSLVPQQSWDRLGRGFLSYLGRDKDGNYSPLLFLNHYGDIAPQAKDVLFGANTPLRQNLEDLATVSRQWKNVFRYGNPSGTAGHGAGIATAVEGVHHPLETLAAFVGARQVGKFLGGAPDSVQKLLQTAPGIGAAANWVRAIGNRSPIDIGHAARRLSATIGAQLGANVDPLGLAALALHHYLPDEDQGQGGQGLPTP